MRAPELITPAHYTNWMPFVLVRTSTGFSIASRPTPRPAIAGTTAVIGVVCAGFALLTYYKAEWAGAFWPILAIGVLTTVGTPFAIVCHFQHQQRLGPVLAFDADRHIHALPRVDNRLRVQGI